MRPTLLLGVVLLTSCASEPLRAFPSPSATSPAATVASSGTPATTAAPARRLLFTPTPLPTSRPATGLVTYENPILGYRITLPEPRRRAASGVTTGAAIDDGLGYDLYTARTEAEDRTLCLSDGGEIPVPKGEPDLNISAFRDPNGLSAEAWATTPRFVGAQALSTHMLVERTTVGGQEAVRLVRDQQTNHETTAYVIRANDRMYTLRFESDGIPSLLPGWLDTVAGTFRGIQPLPFPTATPGPSIAPLDAARDVGRRLGQAFAARDLDAIAGLITPQCRLGLVPWSPPGVGVGGSARAVVPFLDALRASFDRGSVSVTVDPELQVEAQGTGLFREELYYVRSDWTASAVTMRIDLFLRPIEGRTYWVSARHYSAGLAPCSELRFIFGNAGLGAC